jgi:diguanylate cyclase (GGDEF)-like protein
VKVLVADDDVTSRRMLERLLPRWGYEVTAAADGDAAWEILNGPDAPSLAVLDWVMPGRDGPTICRDLRSTERGRFCHVILLTSRGRTDDIVRGLEAGADDYISKPFEAEELRVRLRAGQRILELENELIASREAFRRQALHDTLTGALNHGALLDVLARESARCGRDGGVVSVLMADLDHFKSVNDTFGHIAGDAVLVETVRRMRSQLRPYDALGRYGGEEFAVVLPGCGEKEAVEVAERIRSSVASLPVETPAGPVPVTTSIGASTGGEGVAGERILAAADSALYAAKESGRNRVRAARPSASGPLTHSRDR